MTKTYRALLTALALSVAAQSGPEKHTSLESVVEVRALDKIRDFVDDAVRRQNRVMDRMAGEVGAFLDTMTEIGTDVAKATNEWLADPTPENEARVTQAVCEGAARGREAADALGGLEEEFKHLIGVVRDGLAARMKETNATVSEVRGQARDYKKRLAELRKAVLQARTMLEVGGHLDRGEIPPELEDKLFRMRVDYTELELVSEIWGDLGDLIEQQMEVLVSADDDYREIGRMMGKLSYQAGSAGRVFGAIGVAESLKLRSKLLSDAYARSREMRGTIHSTFKRMDKIRVGLRHVVAGGKRLPRSVSRKRSPTKEEETSTALAHWFRSLDTPAKEKKTR